MTRPTIRTADELHALLRGPRRDFELAIERLGAANATWQARLRRDHRVCGCQAAAVGLLVGGHAGGIGLAWAHAPVWQVLVGGVAVGVGGMGLAKFLRLALASVRLRRSVRHLEALLAKTP